MCGILGAFLPGGVSQDSFVTALNKLHSRGPDGERVERVGDGFLGHKRLALMDLDERASQPFIDATSRFVMVFNGEIYNFKDLRDELGLSNDFFRTQSDTEVLLEGFIREGEDFLKRIDGMFAFAIYDSSNNSLCLYRDQFGIKPLHFYAENDSFLFASQIEPIIDLIDSDVRLDLDPSSISESLRYGYIPNNRTAYQGIYSVPKGGCLKYCLTTRDLTSSIWYSKPERLPSLKNSSGLVAEVREAVLRSVEKKMIADVPVGLFLSGGIDSSVIAASVSELGFKNLKSYTFSWPGNNEYDETLGARLVAERYQLDPVFVKMDFNSSEIMNRLDRVLSSHHQPFINPTVILSDILSERASKDVKAVLVGDGGDEIFCGYPRYKATNIIGKYSALARLGFPVLKAWLAMNKNESPVGNHLRRRVRKFVEAGFLPHKAFDHYTTLYPKEGLLVGSERRPIDFEFLCSSFNYKDSYLQACQACDMESFLPFNLLEGADRASMLNGLEIRLPFLSEELYALSLRLPDSALVTRQRQKEVLTMAFKHHLPNEVVSAKKRGFNPPVWHWLKNNPRLLEPLRVKDNYVSHFICPKYLQAKLDAFDSGREDSSMMLWGAIVVNRWGDNYA
jgi:asparagine synthase (glutamine-hydrolysing)